VTTLLVSTCARLWFCSGLLLAVLRLWHTRQAGVLQCSAGCLLHSLRQMEARPFSKALQEVGRLE